jgi:hypothetical protein
MLRTATLLGVGQFYAGRNPMIQWKMGGLAIAGVSKPNVPDDEEGVSAVDLSHPQNRSVLQL